MATYDSPRTDVQTNLEASVGSFLSSKILAALGETSTVKIAEGWTPETPVEAGTHVLIAEPGSVSGEITVPEGVSAMLLTGPTGVQATFNVTSDVGVYLTEAKDVISVGLPTGSEPVEATFDGGNGFDIGQVQGSISDYEVSYDNGVLTLVSTDGHTLSLHDLEYIKFEDGSVIMNLDSELDVASGTLYEVILGRTADEGGMDFFSGATNFDDVLKSADFLLHSDEFTSSFGDVDQMSDESFLDLMYQSAFGRDADEGGQEYWLDQLAGGMSKAAVAVNFAVSSEAGVTFEGLINLETDPNAPSA